jgi:NAD(P)-dependent dehydrogenase (short-subunit alcohol dehydrogenase family)
MADIDLIGQVAFVTGGGRGLGRGMAQALAAAGAAVAVVGRTEGSLVETVELITGAGGRAAGFPADVADRLAVESVVRQVEQMLGPVSILVNNAGVTGRVGPIWEIDPEDWQHTLDLNLNGTLWCTRAILPGMIARRQGRIINVASGSALAPIPYGTAYCVTKAALLRFTECLTADTRELGIIAFAIDPGSVRTDMTEYLISSPEGQKYLPWYRQFILSGGDVPAELSANLVTLLASGKADRLNGRFIRVSDDLDSMLRQADTIQNDDLYTLRLRSLPA